MSEKNTTPETSPKATQGEVELKVSQMFMSEQDDNISDSEKVMKIFFLNFEKYFHCYYIYIYIYKCRIIKDIGSWIE